MNDPTTGDTPTHRRTISEMSDDELFELIKAKRQRLQELQKERVKKYRADAAKISTDRMHKQYLKNIEMLEKEIDKVDKFFDKIEARLAKVRTQRLELFGVDALDGEKPHPLTGEQNG